MDLNLLADVVWFLGMLAVFGALSGLYVGLCMWTWRSWFHRHRRDDMFVSTVVWLLVTGMILIFGALAIHNL